MREQVPLELQIVLPVYNEEATVGSVVDEWCQHLDHCSVHYRIVAMDDGSTDATPQVLENLRKKWGLRLEVIRQVNCGHGQTAIKGYRLAVERGIPWVFQIDSDGQCDPRFFPQFWQGREGYDIISGYRTRRDDGRYRQLVSTFLRWFILVFSRTYCKDANVRYRLMRTAAIEPLLGKIPRTFSVANVALAILAKRARLRHYFIPISFRARQGGTPFVSNMKFPLRALVLYRNLKELLAK